MAFPASAVHSGIFQNLCLPLSDEAVPVYSIGSGDCFFGLIAWFDTLVNKRKNFACNSEKFRITISFVAYFC